MKVILKAYFLSLLCFSCTDNRKLQVVVNTWSKIFQAQDLTNELNKVNAIVPANLMSLIEQVSGTLMSLIEQVSGTLISIIFFQSVLCQT